MISFIIIFFPIHSLVQKKKRIEKHFEMPTDMGLEIIMGYAINSAYSEILEHFHFNV